MKLRLQKNSVRLRLSEAEVSELASSGRVREAVPFGLGAGETLIYEICTDEAASEISVRLDRSRITVTVSAAAARSWASSGDVVLQSESSDPRSTALRIVVEKDLGRRHPAGEKKSGRADVRKNTDAPLYSGEPKQ